jgi:hypothetical protein
VLLAFRKPNPIWSPEVWSNQTSEDTIPMV